MEKKMKIIKKVFLGAAFLLMGILSVNARAGILDIRGGVGMSSTNVDDFDEQAKAANGNGIDANDFQTYNVDIFINLPALPIGFGIRHEWLNLNEGSGGSELDLKATNLALLVDLRLIDTDHFYIGPIISIGHPSAKVDFQSGAVTMDKHINGNDVSYAGALETGVYLGHFLIGAEAGYQNIELEGSTNQGNTAKFDASGFYGKAMVGLTFF
jgi:hypothetical protein